MIERIVLSIGEKQELRLPGLGAAGYSWEASGFDVALVSVSRVPQSPPTTAGPPTAGASVNPMFCIEALAPGNTTIHFRLQRPFAKHEPPVEERSFEVTIAMSPV
jgi:hypothetical protein